VADISQRIKSVRKIHKLTQSELGKIIGVAGNTVTNYELGNREPSNAVITLLCKELGVNEVWLRTGEGGDENMFAKVSEDDRYIMNLGKLTSSENEFVRNGVNLLAESDPEKLKVIEDFMKAWLGIE